MNTETSYIMETKREAATVCKNAAGGSQKVTPTSPIPKRANSYFPPTIPNVILAPSLLFFFYLSLFLSRSIYMRVGFVIPTIVWNIRVKVSGIIVGRSASAPLEP